MLSFDNIKKFLLDATFYLGAILLAGAVALSLFGPGGEQDVLMALGPLAMAGIKVGGSILSSVAGNWINSKFNKKPKYPSYDDLDIDPPNLTDPVSAIFDRQRSKLSKQVNERSDKAEATAAAKNLSASGHAAMMEPVYDSNASAMADLSAEEAQAMNDAKRKEEMMEYQTEVQAKTGKQIADYKSDLAQYRNRAQAIGGITNAIGSGVNNYLNQKMLTEMLNKSGGGDQGGGGTASASQNPMMPFLTMDFSKQGIASGNATGLSGGY